MRMCKTERLSVDLAMAEEAVKDVEMKEAEGGEEKSEKEEASGSQQQKDKNLLIFEGRKTPEILCRYRLSVCSIRANSHVFSFQNSCADIRSGYFV